VVADDLSGTDRTSTELRVRVATSSAGVRPAMSRVSRPRWDWSVYPALAASSANPRCGHRRANAAKR
jgi:hypothetical protein